MLFSLRGFVEFAICGGCLFCCLKLHFVPMQRLNVWNHAALTHTQAFLLRARRPVCSHTLQAVEDGLRLGRLWETTVVLLTVRDAPQVVSHCECVSVCAPLPVSSLPNRKKISAPPHFSSYSHVTANLLLRSCQMPNDSPHLCERRPWTTPLLGTNHCWHALIES